MLSQIRGLHHVTSLASSATGNNAFFTGALGLRRVKKTVNFDAPHLYHLYYGDEVGSPGTVADRILDLQAKTGGFGHLLIVSYDATGEREAWNRSLQLLMNEVLPRCQSPGASQQKHIGGSS